MGYKNKFTTTAENAMEHFSGWSEVKCETCKKIITNTQLAYSMRFYRRPLCRTCQSLEKYRINCDNRRKADLKKPKYEIFSVVCKDIKNRALKSRDGEYAITSAS